MDTDDSTTVGIRVNQAKVEAKYWTMEWMQARTDRHHTSALRLIEVYLKHVQPLLRWGGGV